ncbi:CAF17-like 4Fe-4S cluster assembly/insertion protein YgfZ [Corynebacterium anserum]|uniref:CAF17-like 4Fe-4S cluster assembly/insertion protein YgfZ n=1 Tax=Corynebacterium anserum TaxID=2684406 RepID=UPI00163B15BD|nr:folate-binding protein YgfZ [Corynebacterium anserum]
MDNAEKLSPILSHVPSASNEADGHTLPVAWHYGNPLTEQSRLGPSSPGLVDLWDRTTLLVSGPEATTWLNNLISQKVNAIQEGQATWGLILDVHGHVEHYFGISALENGLMLDVDSAHADLLEEYLHRMIFWSQVEITRPPLAQLAIVGAEYGDFQLEGPNQAQGDAHTFRRSRRLGDVPVTDIFLPREEITSHWDDLAHKATPTGLMAYTALRIQAREPDINLDLDERTIPHEVPAFIGSGIQGATQKEVREEGPTESAVHLNKGCYRGQETVSRVHNLGKSPRVLVQLHLDGSADHLPKVGCALNAGGRDIGRVGSSVHDADYGPIALALVKRGVVEKMAKNPAAVPNLMCDGVDAAIDPDDIRADDAARPGRAAIRTLRKNN